MTNENHIEIKGQSIFTKNALSRYWNNILWAVNFPFSVLIFQRNFKLKPYEIHRRIFNYPDNYNSIRTRNFFVLTEPQGSFISNARTSSLCCFCCSIHCLKLWYVILRIWHIHQIIKREIENGKSIYTKCANKQKEPSWV